MISGFGMAGLPTLHQVVKYWIGALLSIAAIAASVAAISTPGHGGLARPIAKDYL
jgi:hypothetical protein